MWVKAKSVEYRLVRAKAERVMQERGIDAVPK